jgi:hypothetical protein
MLHHFADSHIINYLNYLLTHKGTHPYIIINEIAIYYFLFSTYITVNKEQSFRVVPISCERPTGNWINYDSQFHYTYKQNIDYKNKKDYLVL